MVHESWAKISSEYDIIHHAAWFMHDRWWFYLQNYQWQRRSYVQQFKSTIRLLRKFFESTRLHYFAACTLMLFCTSLSVVASRFDSSYSFFLIYVTGSFTVTNAASTLARPTHLREFKDDHFAKATWKREEIFMSRSSQCGKRKTNNIFTSQTFRVSHQSDRPVCHKRKACRALHDERT